MTHEESILQRSCIKDFRDIYPKYELVMFAVGNGGKRGAVEAAIMKAEGVTAGVADVLFLVPNKHYHGLCIEFKTRSKSSRQSDHQKAWQAAIEPQGYKYAIVRDAEEFWDLVTGYLSEK